MGWGIVGIDGQYLASLSVGGDNDFLTEDDLVEFTVIEEAGNKLPTYVLNFTSKDERILSKLNEGQVIQAKLGKTLSTLNDYELTTNKLKTSKEGEDLRYYETVGFASNIDYITDHFLQITSTKSGIAAAIETAGKHFTVVSKVFTSFDSQKWIQPNITNKAFVNNCLMHSDMGSSFPVFAITADGKFLIKDIVKEARSFGFASYDWKFTREALTSRDIVYDGDPVITSEAGFINNWIGYGRETIVYNIATGLPEIVYEEPTTLLSLSSEVDKATAIDKRFNGSRALSSNVHPNYWSSYNHNLQSLANLSKIDVALSFSNLYHDVKPLDLVMYSENANASENQAGEYQSGLYVVSKVIKQVMGKRLTTTVLLNREAFNSISNE